LLVASGRCPVRLQIFGLLGGACRQWIGKLVTSIANAPECPVDSQTVQG